MKTRTNLRTYFKGNKNINYKKYNLKAVKYDNSYIMTNTYSILKLNKIGEDIEITKNKQIKETLNNFYVDFKLNYKLYEERVDEKLTKDEWLGKENIEKNNEKIFIKDEDINNILGLGISMEYMKVVYKIIKPTRIDILKKENINYNQYVFKLENEKNGEIAYVLPKMIY